MATTRFDLYAPGLEQVGLGPDRVLFVEARDDKEVLAVMEDGTRSSLRAVAWPTEVRRSVLRRRTALRRR